MGKGRGRAARLHRLDSAGHSSSRDPTPSLTALFASRRPYGHIY